MRGSSFCLLFFYYHSNSKNITPRYFCNREIGSRWISIWRTPQRCT